MSTSSDDIVAPLAGSRKTGPAVPSLARDTDRAHHRLELLAEAAAMLLEGQDPDSAVLPAVHDALRPVRDPEDEYVLTATGLLSSLARDRAAERRKLADANRELSHRVKNMLAMVQAIATVSARTAGSLDEFIGAFHDRIEALSKTQDLLADGLVHGVSLRQLLAAELDPYGEEGHLLLDGPGVRLPPALAVPLGMAIHELTTNAVKYGALATGSGLLTVRWRQDGQTPPQRLMIDWIESGGLPVTAPKRRGFGSKLLDRLPGKAIRVARTFDPAGLRARLEVALG